jgi:hydroxymethylpyrimidine pyrophosphatase-like HAD family hydrolase
MKKYKVVFFDWDGTAVASRTAPVDALKPLLVSLLDGGMVLIIISGTTYENIAGGQLHFELSAGQLKNLYFGLGRGAVNYGFDHSGELLILKEVKPDISEILKIHDVAFRIHTYLLENFGLKTDIVFSRPNYCKINLLTDSNRMDRFSLEASEVEMVNILLEKHHFKGGLPALVDLAKQIARINGLSLDATTDAKFLEIGPTTKADNVGFFLNEVVFRRKIEITECAFWGDEFADLAPGVKGSDALMMVEETVGADFYDVSDRSECLPDGVVHIGGGPPAFARFLQTLIRIINSSQQKEEESNY